MSESSLLGRAQHKGKSINVEANLLDEWLSEKRAVEAQVRVRILLTIGVAMIGLVLLPILVSLFETALAKESRAQAHYDALAKQMTALEAKGKKAAPVIAYQDMAKQEQRRNELFMGHLLLVFNAAPNKVALSKLKAEVIGGELSILCSADAEDLTSGNSFVTEASKGPQVEYAVLSSSRKSSALSKDGIGFDFNKKIKVGK